MLEVTAGGRPVRYLESTPSVRAKNLTLSIDLNLQKVVEKAFGAEAGAMIAIDPSTGEILAFVSKPTYDPNLFLNGIDYDTWNQLNTSPRKPLLNRAMRGIYPIGSTYKPFMALAGLQYGVITPSTTINDQGVYELGGHKFRDAAKVHKGILDLRRSITVSSDIYYYKLAHDLGAERIHDFMEPWGFGQLTASICSANSRASCRTPPGRRSSTRSRGLSATPFRLASVRVTTPSRSCKLAHAVATLADRGVALQPHLVRSIYDPKTHKSTEMESTYRKEMPVSKKNIEFIIDAMTTVTQNGTAAGAFRGAPYIAAGKTARLRWWVSRRARAITPPPSRSSTATMASLFPLRRPPSPASRLLFSWRTAASVPLRRAYRARRARLLAPREEQPWPSPAPVPARSVTETRRGGKTMTGDFQTVRRLWISFLERLSRMNFGLAIVVAILTLTGFMTLFSAGYSYPWRVADQAGTS